MCNACKASSVGKLKLKMKKKHYKRRRARVGAINTSGATAVLMTGATATAGFLVSQIASKQLLNKLTFLTDIPFVKNIAKAAVGALLAANSKSAAVKAMGVGVIVESIHDLAVTDLKFGSTLGISGFLPYGNVSGVFPYSSVSGKTPFDHVSNAYMKPQPLIKVN